MTGRARSSPAEALTRWNRLGGRGRRGRRPARRAAAEAADDAWQPVPQCSSVTPQKLNWLQHWPPPQDAPPAAEPQGLPGSALACRSSRATAGRSIPI